MSSRSLPVKRSILVATLVLSAPALAFAGWPESPTANLLVCSAPADQSLLQSASDGADGVILTWGDTRPGAPGIYAQRVSVDGVPLWGVNGMRIYFPPLGVIDVARRMHVDPEEVDLAIVSDGTGGAIIAWKDSVGPGETDILAQRVTSAGTLAWDPAAVSVCRASGRQVFPKLVSDGAGGAIIAWQDYRGGSSTVRAQRVDAAGSCAWTPDGLLVTTGPENIQLEGWASLALVMSPHPTGGAILTWTSHRGIIAQRLDASGAALWSATGAVVYAHTRNESQPDIVPDGNQGAFIAWSDYRDGGAGVYAQHLDASGSRLWAVGGRAIIDGPFDSWHVRLASDTQGGCILLWMDTRPYSCGPCNGSLIYGQRLNGAGTALWAPGGVVVSDATRGSGAVNQRVYPQVVPDGSGGALFTYMLNVTGNSHFEFCDIYAQRIGPDGARLWSSDVLVCSDPASQSFPVLVRSHTGGAIVAWEDQRAGSIDIAAQLINSDGRPGPYIDFTDIGAGLTGVDWGSTAWGDYDRDGDLDILLTGRTHSPDGNQVIPVTRLYRNNGSGAFAEVSTGLPGVYRSSVAWGDYDNDTDLDILLTGYTAEYGPAISRIYRNEGGVFVDIVAGLPGVYSGSVAWGDADNDGDLDLLLTGDTGSGFVSRVYRNNGGASFTDMNAGLPGVYLSSVAWGDCDNDGSLDFVLTGYTEAASSLSRVYRNNGSGVFTDAGAGLPEAYYSSVAWGDYDSDGDLDLLLAGWSGSLPISRVYRNDGGGVLTDAGAPLPGVQGGSAAWGDYDNDGDLDILLTGQGASQPLAVLFRNEGGGAFTGVDVGLPWLWLSSVAWGDCDNDGDLDMLVTGAELACVYRSDGAPPNTRPWIPDGPWAVDIVGGDVTLTWTPSSDLQTPVPGLSYNLRVGTTPGGSEIVSAMADPTTGYRRVAQPGNAQKRASWTFHLPEVRFLCWSVQAIDGAYAGSRFSPERFFGPVPIQITDAEIEANSDRIAVTWYSAISPGATRIYRRTEDSDWVALGSTTFDGSGYLRYEDTSVRSGVRYGYRLGVFEGTQEVFVGETWAAVPAMAFALESVSPNPVVRDLAVTLSLPDASPATLEVLNVAGRRIMAEDVGRLGPGRHVVRLGLERKLPAGIYLLRLTREAHMLNARVVVLR